MMNSGHNGVKISTSNLLVDNYQHLPMIIKRVVSDIRPSLAVQNFHPGYFLPELDDELRNYFSVAQAKWWNLPPLGSRSLALLDLMRNPETKTTKTVASLIMVARAIEYIRRTNESIIIVCPTSGNKGIAIRDAVGRAIAAGIVSPRQLRVVLLLPAMSRHKLRDDYLATSEELVTLNPVFIYDDGPADGVKKIAKEFVEEYSEDYFKHHNTRIWYSLDIRNYKIADAVRAFFENTVSPLRSKNRIHAHSVSSAYGLLGYSLGRDVLEDNGLSSATNRPSYLLVQHLATPDMVLNLHFDSFDRGNLPNYEPTNHNDLYAQSTDPRFPYITNSIDEVIDRTFYTSCPLTAPEMSKLIQIYGGSGIVVSKAECLSKLPWIKSVLSYTDIVIPDSIHDIREWSLIMAFTGVAFAIERSLLSNSIQSVVVHGSGFYCDNDYVPMKDEIIRVVRSLNDVRNSIGKGAIF